MMARNAEADVTVIALVGERGREVRDFDRRELARTMAVVPQESVFGFPYTVLEVVLMGRHPHLAGLAFEAAADLELAREALRRCDAEAFAGADAAWVRARPDASWDMAAMERTGQVRLADDEALGGVFTQLAKDEAAAFGLPARTTMVGRRSARPSTKPLRL